MTGVDERVAQWLGAMKAEPRLVHAKVGLAFDPGHGRLMKEWLTVTSPNASWIDLAREAYCFVAGEQH